MIEKILRVNPVLRYYNHNKMSDRLRAATDNNMFLAFNGFTKKYELHSVKSFKYNGESLQAVFEDDRMLNEFLIRDVRANDLEKFGQEIRSNREYLDGVHDKHEEKISSLTGVRLKKYLEGTLGRRV